jgi:outer membrane protein TolC
MSLEIPPRGARGDGPAALARLLPGVALALIVAAPVSAALDIETVMREAAATHPRVAARRALADAARARASTAGAWESPLVELGVENVPQGGGFDRDPMTMKVVGVVQRIPLNRVDHRAEAQGERAELEMVRVTRNQIMGEAFAAYAAAFHAGERASRAEAHRALMDRLVQAARARYESARGRLEDVLRAEAERGRLLADVANFRAEERAARARLDALRGGPVPSGGALATPPRAAVPEDGQVWLAAVTADQPRLRELEARAESYRLGGASARRWAWPDLELRGFWGLRGALADGSSTAHGGPAVEDQDDMFSATVAFKVPLFAGQREIAEGREMDAMARVAEAERWQALLALRQEVTEAHAMALAAQQAAALLADTVLVVQRRALDASWAAYGSGASDMWRALEAAHALYGEEIALERTREGLAGAQGRLIALTGRGDLVGVSLPAGEE